MNPYNIKFLIGDIVAYKDKITEHCATVERIIIDEHGKTCYNIGYKEPRAFDRWVTTYVSENEISLLEKSKFTSGQKVKVTQGDSVIIDTIGRVGYNEKGYWYDFFTFGHLRAYENESKIELIE